jgi:hypothetical protein
VPVYKPFLSSETIVSINFVDAKLACPNNSFTEFNNSIIKWVANVCLKYADFYFSETVQSKYLLNDKQRFI